MVSPKVFITGASGLLGKSLVKRFLKGGFQVLAQYHSRPLEIDGPCQWIQADFFDLQRIRQFLNQHEELLKECRYLINNYGPITNKSVKELQSEDFQHDYHHNVITAYEISRFMLTKGNLDGVTNIGFQFMGETMAYRRIVTYAAAKNALLLMTRSMARTYPDTTFLIEPLPTLEGAEVAPKGHQMISPDDAADMIYKKMIL